MRLCHDDQSRLGPWYRGIWRDDYQYNTCADVNDNSSEYDDDDTNIDDYQYDISADVIDNSSEYDDVDDTNMMIIWSRIWYLCGWWCQWYWIWCWYNATDNIVRVDDDIGFDYYADYEDE